MELFNLSKNELVKVMKAYNDYVMEYFEEHEEGCPCSIYEFYDNEYQEFYNTEVSTDNNLFILRQKFYQEFNVERCVSDIMDLVDEKDLKAYMIEEFGDSFMYGELFDLFKDEMGKEDLQGLLEEMGFTYVDLDELNEEERKDYY